MVRLGDDADVVNWCVRRRKCLLPVAVILTLLGCITFFGEEEVAEAEDQEKIIEYLLASHVNKKSTMKYAQTFREHGYMLKDQVSRLTRAQLTTMGLAEGHVDLLEQLNKGTLRQQDQSTGDLTGKQKRIRRRSRIKRGSTNKQISPAPTAAPAGPTPPVALLTAAPIDAGILQPQLATAQVVLQSQLPPVLQPSACSKYLTTGWHEGHTVQVETLGSGDSWEKCAQNCAEVESTVCARWTVDTWNRCAMINGPRGAYHDVGGHTEGDRDRACLPTAHNATATPTTDAGTQPQLATSQPSHSPTPASSLISSALTASTTLNGSTAPKAGGGGGGEQRVSTSWKDAVEALKLPLKEAKRKYQQSCERPPAGVATGKYECTGCVKTKPCAELQYGMGGSGDRCACGAYNDECQLWATKREPSNMAACTPGPSLQYCKGEKQYPWHAFLGTVQVINLKRRPDRRHYMKEMLLETGVPMEKIEFFDAVDVKQWGTLAFQQRLAKIFKRPGHEMLTTAKSKAVNPCCQQRLKDHTFACDVSQCGLAASGLSHLAAIHNWYAQVKDKPGNPAMLLLEDDVCPTAQMFSPDTQKLLQLENIPKDWKMIKFEDCLGRFPAYSDKAGCNGDCNQWRRVKDIRSFAHGAACVSAYAFNKKSAAEIVGWGAIYEPVLEARLWDYAMIEDVVNVLAWGPWAEQTYQPRWNLFSQTEGLDSLEGNGVESDNHPASLQLTD
jgi:hypothetical protein